MPGQPVTHTYRSPFLRGCDDLDLRPQPFAKGDDQAGAVVVMSRPRGYFGVGRDKFSLDGKVPPGINDGVPGAASGRLAFDAAARTVMAVFNTETIAARTWPVKDNHIVVVEFTESLLGARHLGEATSASQAQTVIPSACERILVRLQSRIPRYARDDTASERRQCDSTSRTCT